MDVIIVQTLASMTFISGLAALWKLSSVSKRGWTIFRGAKRNQMREIRGLVKYHPTADAFIQLVDKDGSGAWPPRANHSTGTWPRALQAYHEILTDMIPALATSCPSLDDKTNGKRIAKFRAQFRQQLDRKVDLDQVQKLLDTVASDRWDIVPRDTYNAFYCCLASCRHAYRWGTIPVVKVAQLERNVELPAALAVPWYYLQRHFGCDSDSGNNTSNIIHNFDEGGAQVYRVNTGLAEAKIKASEEAFSRIFLDIEVLGLPIYQDMILATIFFGRGEKSRCMHHMTNITSQLRLVLQTFYDRVHDHTIALSVWLSHVQGFFAWNAGRVNASSGGEYIIDHGLSGNQILLFQALDAFLGLRPYLSAKTLRANVPARQREFCEVLEKHTFRTQVRESREEYDGMIEKLFQGIVKLLRRFRSAHQHRVPEYLLAPAPERIPMGAGTGTSVLNDGENGMKTLKGFMKGRLNETR